MKVIVDSNIIIKNAFEPPVELHLKDQCATLKDVLKAIDQRCAVIQLLKDGELGEDVRNIFLNGTDYFSLPERLGTIMNEDDKVEIEIYMEPLGGG